MTNPTPVVFIVGLCGPAQSDYDGLMFKTPTWNIRSYWGARLSKGTPLLVTQWNLAGFDKVYVGKPEIPTINHANAIAKLVRDAYPGQRVNIVGHSLGGYMALQAAAALAPMQPIVTCLDPVNRDRYASTPDTTGILAPSNAAAVFNYYRQVGSPSPWSTFISSVHVPLTNGVTPITTVIYNIVYPTKSSQSAGDAHGAKVWDAAVIAQVAKG